VHADRRPGDFQSLCHCQCGSQEAEAEDKFLKIGKLKLKSTRGYAIVLDSGT
jgi:hypothetical protein